LSGYAGYNSESSSIILPKMGAKLTGKVALRADGGADVTVGSGTTAELKLSTSYVVRKYTTTVGSDGVFLFGDLPEYSSGTLSFAKGGITYTLYSSSSVGKSGTTNGSTTSTTTAYEVVE
jgi:hypothetical protein